MNSMTNEKRDKTGGEIGFPSDKCIIFRNWEKASGFYYKKNCKRFKNKMCESGEWMRKRKNMQWV